MTIRACMLLAAMAVGTQGFADKPSMIVAELDAVAEKVKVGMSDADVKDICENYLSTFVNIRQIAAHLTFRLSASEHDGRQM